MVHLMVQLMLGITRGRLAALIAALCIGVMACQERDATDRRDVAGRAQAEVERAPGLPPPATDAGAVVNQVHVALRDHQVEMPEQLPMGLTDFMVTNHGATMHSFVLEGQGIEARLQGQIDPGASMLMRVDLVPGSYRAYCPVDDHEERGMEARLTVIEELPEPTPPGEAAPGGAPATGLAPAGP
jgi:hypothetical protein